MRKLSMIAVVGVAVMLLAVGTAQAAFVYQTGFESPPYTTGNLGGQDGWTKWNSGTEGFTVQTVTVQSGTRAVKATVASGYDKIDGVSWDPVLSVGATDIMTLSYDQYLPSAWFAPINQSSRSLSVRVRPYYTDPEWNDPYYNLVLSTWMQYSGGYMQRIGFGVDGSELAVTFNQAVLADTWSNLRLVVNNGTGCAEAFLNGSSLGTVTFTPGGITSFESIEMDAYNLAMGSQVAYVDNLSFSIVPEPATMALLALGGLAMLRRRKSA